MEETLDRALDRLFPAEGGPPPTRSTAVDEGADVGGEARRAPSGALGAVAREHYERAIQAQREGNWGLYGEEIHRLGDILNQLNGRP
jgi:uncharacterized membrane protein (UPF0182 family)